MEVTIIVATFGGQSWVDLAEQRAIPSAEQFRVPVIHSHGDSLHDARNWGLDLARTEWVVFLDSDDELDAGYLDAIDQGTADVRAPAVAYVRNGRARRPTMPRVAGHSHDCTADCLADGNWLVVGSAARTRLLRDVGGWREWPCYEDWDLWARCWLAGATFEAVPDAVYRAHVRPDSRNRGQLTQAEKHAVHQQIARSIGVKVPADWGDPVRSRHAVVGERGPEMFIPRTAGRIA